MTIYFSVESYCKEKGVEDWVEELNGINKDRQAIELAQQIASRDKVRTRVIRNDDKVMARFDANGNRVKNPGREARRRRKYRH